MASDRDFYPDGTDMSYFDQDSTDMVTECPSCKETGNQLVFIDGDRRHLQGECEECGHTWEKSWHEEPDIDYYDEF